MPKKLIDSKAKTKMWRKSIKVIVFELTHRKTKQIFKLHIHTCIQLKMKMIKKHLQDNWFQNV